MPDNFSQRRNLGKLIAVHATATAYVQRAAIVAILAFLFFVGMLVAFLVRQHFMYLILAAAFFVVNIFTLIGFVLQRRNVVRVYENGLSYGKTRLGWDQIATVDKTESGEMRIHVTGAAELAIPKTIDRIEELLPLIRKNSS